MGSVLFGFIQDSQKSTGPGEGLGFTLGMAAFMILLGPFLIFCLLQDWRKNRNYTVALFEGGLALSDHDGNIRSVAWKDINYLQAIRLKQGRFHKYNLICKDGRILVLHHFLEGLNELVSSAKRGIRFEG